MLPPEVRIRPFYTTVALFMGRMKFNKGPKTEKDKNDKSLYISIQLLQNSVVSTGIRIQFEPNNHYVDLKQSLPDFIPRTTIWMMG